MNPQQFHRLTELFYTASELPEEQRSVFLDRACSNDPELRREAEKLLQHDGELPATDSLASPLRLESVAEPQPERIGPYRILQVLGEGAMGVVYKAEQEEPVHRLVAIKLIKLGMDSQEMLARFGLERRAVASMNHSSIAKILDAGTTEHGQCPSRKRCPRSQTRFRAGTRGPIWTSRHRESRWCDGLDYTTSRTYQRAAR